MNIRELLLIFHLEFMKSIYLIIVFSATTFLMIAQAIVPLSDIVSGMSRQDVIPDPLEGILSQDYVDVKSGSPVMENRTELFKFIGFYREGIALKNKCSATKKMFYKNQWEQEQAKRAILATLQQIGLKITSQAIVQYVKDFEFTDDEFANFSDNLIGNYCSKNITVISHKELKNNMLKMFKSESKVFDLPNIDENSLFPADLERWTNSISGKQQEFFVSVDLFRSFCSWGNDVANLRLMAPMVNDPFIMSYVFRNLTGKTTTWDQIDNSTKLINAKDSLRVACEGYICRSKNSNQFMKQFPRSWGSRSIMEELESIYCFDFRDARNNFNEPIVKLKKILDSRTLSDEIFLRSQMISLFTGVPDFFLNAGTFNEASEILKASFNSTWDRWAGKSIRKFSQDLMYEESLFVESVDRKFFYDNRKPQFKVIFDVNLGEFDKANQLIDKLSASINISLSKSFLKWARRDWKSNRRGAQREVVLSKLVKQLKFHIDDQLILKRNRFIIPPWEGDIGGIIAVELIEQLADYEGTFFNQDDAQNIEIPIEFRYGVFALKYIHERFLSKNNEINI